jgi:hypothetical protein
LPNLDNLWCIVGSSENGFGQVFPHFSSVDVEGCDYLYISGVKTTQNQIAQSEAFFAALTFAVILYALNKG